MGNVNEEVTEEETAAAIPDLSEITPEAMNAVFSSIPEEFSSSIMNDVLEIIQSDISNTTVNPSQPNIDCHGNDWIWRAETNDFGIDPNSATNLLNEAIENIRNDQLLSSAMGSYLVPENADSNSVALSPIDLEQWPEFDFSKFDNNPNDGNDTDV